MRLFKKIRSCTNSPKCPNCEADFFADDEKIRRKTSVERLLVQLLTSLLTAVFLAGVLALPPTANPAFAESNVTSGENDAASSINENYIPPDTTDYVRWTGSAKLAENRSYYIDKQVKITGEKSVTLPKSSKLLIKDGGSLTVYAGSSMLIKGELTVEPSARMNVSGELAAVKDSAIYNYGTFASTNLSTLHLSSVFLTGSKGLTALSGEVYVYRSGTLENHNRLTLSETSDVTLTGKVVCERNSLLFLKGRFIVTMNGELTSNGALYLYTNAACGGEITLGTGSKLFGDRGGRFTLTKAGKYTDNRNRVVSENTAPPDAPSEYDAEPETVNWIGIDVSRYQGAIDWERVKASGVDFVLLRSSIGDGSDSVSGEDIRFSKNVVQAKEAGLMVGAYHYLWAETVEDARKEARFFIKTISPYALDFPAILDFEEPSQQQNLTNAERTRIAKAFLEEVKNAGYYPMLYTNKSWATTYLNMNELSEYELWLAEWFPRPSYTGDFGIWQYTPYGEVSGIAGDVDLDVCYKNYRKIILNGGYNHLR